MEVRMLALNLQNIKNKHHIQHPLLLFRFITLNENLTTKPTNNFVSSYRNLMKGESTTK